MEVLREGLVLKDRSLFLRPFYFWLVARDAPPPSHKPPLRLRPSPGTALRGLGLHFMLSVIKDDLYNRSVI